MLRHGEQLVNDFPPVEIFVGAPACNQVDKSLTL